MITFAELKNKSLKLFPALFLEKYSTFKGRKLTRTVLLWILCVLFSFVVVIPTLSLDYGSLTTSLLDYEKNIRSSFFFIFSLWVSMYLVEAFYFSFYFRQAEVDFEIAKLAINSDSADITKSFLESHLGEYTMMRLNIGPDQINNFINQRQRQIRETSFDIELLKDKNYISVRDYGRALYQNDNEFSFFLSQYGISESDFIGSLEWVDDIEWKIREFEKWWDKSNLIRKKSIGRKWSFHKVDSIDKYGHSIFIDKNYLNLADHWRVFKKDAHKVESALSRNINSNVLVTANTNDLGMQVIGSLAKMILLGKVLFELEGRRIFVLDTEKIIKYASKDKNIDKIFADILDGVYKKDNTILVIPNLGYLIEKTNEIEIDFYDSIKILLTSDRVQVIGVSSLDDFNQNVQTNINFLNHFEKVKVSETDDKSIIRIIQNIVYEYENNNDIFFTYQSIKQIVNKTRIYFDDVIYPEKIKSIIEKIVEDVKTQDKKVVSIEDVNKIITIEHED